MSLLDQRAHQAFSSSCSSASQTARTLPAKLRSIRARFLRGELRRRTGRIQSPLRPVSPRSLPAARRAPVPRASFFVGRDVSIEGLQRVRGAEVASAAARRDGSIHLHRWTPLRSRSFTLRHVRETTACRPVRPRVVEVRVRRPGAFHQAADLLANFGRS